MTEKIPDDILNMVKIYCYGTVLFSCDWILGKYDLNEKELAIYRFVVKLCRQGAPYLTRLSDEAYQPLLRAVRHLSTETEHLRGFIRFSDYGGLLGAEIEPENRVLPMLRSHFCERCRNESFFIYDRTHREALLYSAGRSRIVPMDSFEPAPPDAEEAEYRALWRRFYDTVAIRERENPRLRMTHMPKRYWSTMTEFQEENPPYHGQCGSRATAYSPAASPAPCAPDGIPAPAICPAPEPSFPASVP